MISRRIIAAAAILCVFASPALAQKTKAQLTTEITTTFPDNTAGQITPLGVRTYETDVIDSIMPTAPVVGGNLACFNGTTGLLQDCGSAPTTVPLTIGITPVASGIGGIIYDNAGKLGEFSVSGSGSVAMTTSPTIAGPTITGTIAGSPTISSPTFSGTVAGANTIPLTVLQNGGGTDFAIGYWGTSAASALAINNCANSLTYSTASHTFGCNASAGTGTVTSVTPGSGLVSGVASSCSQTAITATGTLYKAECGNAQTGTTYTFVDGDRAKLVTASNAAAQAYTLPQAGAASSFINGWYVDVTNISTNPVGVVTITPTTSTINGATSYKMQPGASVRIVSDGTNYQVASPSAGLDSMVKAWVQATQSAGTYTNAASYNASISKTGTGALTLTWPTPFASASYALTCSLNQSSAGITISENFASRLAGSASILIQNGSAVATDEGFSCMAMGRQ